MPKPRLDPPRGLLNLNRAAERVRLARYLPPPPVAFFVEHYWVVEWDLRGEPPFTSESLPYPSVHLVLRDRAWRVTGVTTGRFSQLLQGAGQVFGVKFKPGGFRPFIEDAVSTLTNRSIPAGAVLAFAHKLSPEPAGDTHMVERVEAVLSCHLPRKDEHVSMIGALIDDVAADRSTIRVEQVARRAGMSQRALQRLFKEYVGVTPKWIIRRYRLFEAAEKLAVGDEDGARIAQELGYFDQAHFIRDFKSMVGQSPKAFFAQQGPTRATTPVANWV
jgi:AraC-like DNA-binding protein